MFGAKLKPCAFLLTALVFLSIVKISFGDFSFMILHNNDMHGRFDEIAPNAAACSDKMRAKGKCVGGFARTAHMIRRYRNLAKTGKGPQVLFLNAGDIYTGSNWYSVLKDVICSEFMNLLEPDAVALGNHEFDNGVKGLVPYVEALNSPIVAANLDFSETPELNKIQKSVILELQGHRVGVIGYLTPDTSMISNTGKVKFSPEIEAVKLESEKLKEQGVKIIIALGHSGYLMDKKIAAEVPEVDIVIGGHTNTFLYNGKAPSTEIPEDLYPKVITKPNGVKVPVVQAYAFTKYLGRLNVTFDEEGTLLSFQGQPLFMNNSIHQDEDIVAVLERFRPNITALEHQVLGKSRVLLDASGDICRSRECNFGNFITDAMVDYAAKQSVTKFWTNFPIGIINGGAIRTSIEPFDYNGNITTGDLIAANPFGNQIVTMNLTGEDLLQTIEIGIRSNGETSSGEFLQFSGIHVVYDKTRPPFQRVVSAKARCGHCEIPSYEDIEPDKIYGIVMVSFIAEGGDGHYVLKTRGRNPMYLDNGDIQVLSDYLKEKSPIYPEVQERISFVIGDQANGAPRLLYVPLALSFVFLLRFVF